MTSGGSTGRPKVIVDRSPAAWDTEAFVLQQQADEVVLNPGPLYHNAPFSVTHLSLIFGAHVVGMHRFDPLEALQLIEAYKVSWVSLVPTMMHRIWSLPTGKRVAFDVSSLRIVFHMASPMPPWLKQAWINWLGPERIWELYGGIERQGGGEGVQNRMHERYSALPPSARDPARASCGGRSARARSGRGAAWVSGAARVRQFR
jgi:bile acid-coenzyme A ligase